MHFIIIGISTLDLVQCLKVSYLNYGVYNDSACIQNPVVFGSTGFYENTSNQAEVARYKTVFNSDEYYYITTTESVNGTCYLHIESDDEYDILPYTIPTNNKCIQGNNGYYYKFEFGQSISIYDPTIVYITHQSTICGINTTMVTLPNNTVPSLLGFVDDKYPLLDIRRDVLNGSTFSCLDCGNNKCMDTFQSVYYEQHNIDIQFNATDNTLNINANGCRLLTHQVIDLSNQTESCSFVWKVFPGQENIFITTYWSPFNQYFNIDNKAVSKEFVIPQILYLINTSKSKITFKVNTTLINDTQIMNQIVRVKYPGYKPYYQSMERYYDQYTIYRVPNYGDMEVEIPNVLGNGENYIIRVAAEDPVRIISTVGRDFISVSCGVLLYSVSISDLHLFASGYEVTIYSLKPNTTYSVRVALYLCYTCSQSVQTISLTTLPGISTPFIISSYYNNTNYEIGLAFNTTTPNNATEYSVSMNNRLIPGCIKVPTKCSFTPGFQLIKNNAYKIKILAYFEGQVRSTTYTLTLNLSNDITLQPRTLPSNFQPTIPPRALSLTLPPTTPKPNITTNNDTNTINNQSSNNIKCNNRITILLFISILILF